ncbi:MAG: tetratricopeptide repeat protein [Acidobacteriota bacterium]
MTGRAADALESARRELALCTARSRVRPKAFHVLGGVHQYLDQRHEAERAFRSGLALRQVSPRQRVRLEADLASVVFLEGRVAEARSLFEHALETTRSQGDDYGEAHLLSQLAGTYDGSENDEALRTGEEALAIFRRIHHRREMAILLTNLASIYLETDLAKARAAIDEALAYHLAHSAPSAEGVTLLHRAAVKESDGDLTGAEADLRRAAELLERSASPGVPRVLAALAGTLVATGREPDAERVAERALALAPPGTDDGARIDAMTVLAGVRASQGRRRDAALLLREILRLASCSGIPWAVASAHLGLASLSRQAGRLARARKHLDFAGAVAGAPRAARNRLIVEHALLARACGDDIAPWIARAREALEANVAISANVRSGLRQLTP